MPLTATTESNYNVITMKSKLIRIGNSKGIRLPKAILEELKLGDEVTLEATRGSIVIRPSRKARDGWEQAFRAMYERGDDKLLDSEVVTSAWDAREWEWK